MSFIKCNLPVHQVSNEIDKFFEWVIISIIDMQLLDTDSKNIYDKKSQSAKNKKYCAQRCLWSKKWISTISYLYFDAFLIKGVRLLERPFVFSDLTINSRFGSVVAHLDLDGEVSGSSPGHTKDFKVGTYYLSHKKLQLIPYTMDLQTKVV